MPVRRMNSLKSRAMNCGPLSEMMRGCSSGYFSRARWRMHSTSASVIVFGAGLLDRWNRKPSKKGTGFVQPLRPHEHWHIDVAYLNLGGTFYYLCSILDGASRAIVHWEIREAMTEADVECILLRAREKHPSESPR